MRTIVIVFALTFVADLYISFNIVSACVRGLGESGCVGVSDFMSETFRLTNFGIAKVITFLINPKILLGIINEKV
jgi:hypothetical protein